MLWVLLTVLAVQILTLWRQEKLMSTVLPGLAALQAAQTQLTASVNAAVVEIQSEAAAIAASGTEDASVLASAQNISAQATALQNAVAAATPAPAAPSSGS
jgi:hypothetical protein